VRINPSRVQSVSMEPLGTGTTAPLDIFDIPPFLRIRQAD
jgi:hypothetical protein